MNINTTDKVQVGDSTAGTSTSTTYRTSPPTEYGWACPRCGRINAPWKSSCDCSGYGWQWTWDWWKTPNDEWWKHVYCSPDTFRVHPETTTWKTPSSTCGSDSATVAKSNTTTTYVTGHNPVVGGSDYKEGNTYVNVPSTQSNNIHQPDIAINDFTTYRTDIPKAYTKLNQLKENR